MIVVEIFEHDRSSGQFRTTGDEKQLKDSQIQQAKTQDFTWKPNFGKTTGREREFTTFKGLQ